MTSILLKSWNESNISEISISSSRKNGLQYNSTVPCFSLILFYTYNQKRWITSSLWVNSLQVIVGARRTRQLLLPCSVATSSSATNFIHFPLSLEEQWYTGFWISILLVWFSIVYRSNIGMVCRANVTLHCKVAEGVFFRMQWNTHIVRRRMHRILTSANTEIPLFYSRIWCV